VCSGSYTYNEILVKLGVKEVSIFPKNKKKKKKTETITLENTLVFLTNGINVVENENPTFQAKSPQDKTCWFSCVLSLPDPSKNPILFSRRILFI
jgi:hypothetical protein